MKETQQINKMILGVGTDILNIKRIERLIKIFDRRFMKKILTKSEINFLKNNERKEANYLSNRFAAKEAVSKAIGTGMCGISFQDIEIKNNVEGKPYVQLSKKCQNLINTKFNCKKYNVHISISDMHPYTIAFATLSKIQSQK